MSLFPVAITQEQGREIEIARLHAKLETTARRLEQLSLQQDEDSYRLYNDGKFVAVLKNRGSMSLDIKITKTAGISSETTIRYLNENLTDLLRLEANTLQRIRKAEFSYMISTPRDAIAQGFKDRSQTNYPQLLCFELRPRTFNAVLEA